MEIADRYRGALLDRPILRTPRFKLRRPVASDGPAIVNIVGDWDVASRLARIPHPYALADAHFFIEEIVPSELVWAITDRQSDEMLGAIGLSLFGPDQDLVEIGYYVGRDHWGRGVATEAGSVVIAFAVGVFGATRLRSGHFADNPASGNVLQKIGFVPTGTSERYCLTTDEMKSSVEMTYGRGR